MKFSWIKSDSLNTEFEVLNLKVSYTGPLTDLYVQNFNIINPYPDLLFKIHSPFSSLRIDNFLFENIYYDTKS